MFFFYKPNSASEQTSERVFVLRDGNTSFVRLLLLLITAGSEPEARTVAFWCKLNGWNRALKNELMMTINVYMELF